MGDSAKIPSTGETVNESKRASSPSNTERSSISSRLRKREWDPTSVVSPERGPAQRKETKREKMVPSKRSLTAHYKRDEKKAGPTDKKEVKNEVKNDESWADIMENEERCSKNGSQRGSQEKLTELESDPLVLQRRQKQIDYGKNTLAYDNYINLIPREERKKEHPKTPNKYEKYSRRGWDGTVKVWKKMLHAFEPEGVQAKSSQPAPVQKKKTTDAADALDESFEDLAFDILDE